MPRFLVFVPGSEDSEAGQLPSTEQVDEMTKFNEKLADAGLMVEGAGLAPMAESKRIRFEGGKATVLDGPFAEAKELVAGYWELEAKSLDEVLQWMKKAPFDGGVEITVRPVTGLEDFDEIITPEIRERQERIQKKIQQR